MYSGTTIYGNVFYRVTYAALIGGGRDNSIVNNIFVECNPSVHVDARAMGWAKYHADNWMQELKEKRTHLGVEILKAPYIDRYPAIATLTTGNAYAPEGNLIARNVQWGGRWADIKPEAGPFVRVENNVLDKDPRFVDAVHLNFQLRDDSPAYTLGFQRIPIEQIGPYRDANRASWPVRSLVPEVPANAGARSADSGK
jgi:hypothetical protein